MRERVGDLFRRWPTGEEIEEDLLAGNTISLQLAPDFTIRVALDGITGDIVQQVDIPEGMARHLLLSSRYSQEQKETGRVEPHQPPPGVRTVHISLTPRRARHVGDVLAARFRLTEDQ